MGRSAIYTDDRMMDHETGQDHPESSTRLNMIRERLQKKGYFDYHRWMNKRVAKPEELALAHSPDYIQKIQKLSESGERLDPDTAVSTGSWEAARISAGGGLEAADLILAGEIKRALLIIRPPGHHATFDQGMGFCLFNNVAVAARYFQKRGLEKVSILDWDVHHGNGTESIFYEDPTVQFISIHQFPIFPDSGPPERKGEGAGFGTNLNVPMKGGSGDEEYREAFESVILPEMARFSPDILLISAGFDAHKDDPISEINLSTSMFEWMTRTVVEFAEAHTNGRIVSFLEGGYELRPLVDSVEAHASAIM